MEYDNHNPFEGDEEGVSMLDDMQDIAKELAGENGDPVLGEDNHSVRSRAKAAIEKRRGTAAAAATPKTFEELKAKHQVDLDDESQLDNLEDSGLMQHMTEARARLEKHELEAGKLLNSGEIRIKDVEAKQALSSLMVAVKDQLMATQCAAANVMLHSTNVRKLSAGQQPHGYPEITDSAKVFAMLETRLKSSGKEISAIASALEDFDKNLTLARRNHETVVEALTRRCEYYEELSKLTRDSK